LSAILLRPSLARLELDHTTRLNLGPPHPLPLPAVVAPTDAQKSSVN
jgi:hypothetical protein